MFKFIGHSNTDLQISKTISIYIYSVTNLYRPENTAIQGFLWELGD